MPVELCARMGVLWHFVIQVLLQIVTDIFPISAKRWAPIDMIMPGKIESMCDVFRSCAHVHWGIIAQRR
jgi:hypothetical protein